MGVFLRTGRARPPGELERTRADGRRNAEAEPLGGRGANDAVGRSDVVEWLGRGVAPVAGQRRRPGRVRAIGDENRQGGAMHGNTETAYLVRPSSREGLSWTLPAHLLVVTGHATLTVCAA